MKNSSLLENKWLSCITLRSCDTLSRYTTRRAKGVIRVVSLIGTSIKEFVVIELGNSTGEL